MKTGAKLISDKRDKHTTKYGYNYNHDTKHTPMQFVNAARAYMYTESNQWPFDKQSFKTGTKIEDLVNAGSMIAAAIDLLQRYQVDKVYEVKSQNQQGTFKVIKIEMLRSGTVLIHFIGLSGDLRVEKQKFMLGSIFDENSNPI